MKPESGDHIHGEITGDVSGQAAIGKHITQQAHVGAGTLTPEERAELDRRVSNLRDRVAAEAPEEEREAALERVDELRDELESDDPDPTTLSYVGQWLIRKVPSIGGAVVSTVVNPLVGKLVGAAAEGIAEQLRARLGG